MSLPDAPATTSSPFPPSRSFRAAEPTTGSRAHEEARAFVVRAGGVRVRISVGEDSDVWQVDRVLT